jgi:hypothetical protein
MHGVPIGQSAAVEHVAHTWPGHACVMQLAGVQGSVEVSMQNFDSEHIMLAQSVSAAHGAPPSKAQMPLLQWPLAQSASAAQAWQTEPEQRPDPQGTSSKHGSPRASLHCPASQTPLKQASPVEHGSPKWPIDMASMQLPVPSQAVLTSQWFTRSSTPLGIAQQVPGCPGMAHEVQMAQAAAPQQVDSTQWPLRQSPSTWHVDPSGPPPLELVPVEELALLEALLEELALDAEDEPEVALEADVELDVGPTAEVELDVEPEAPPELLMALALAPPPAPQVSSREQSEESP